MKAKFTDGSIFGHICTMTFASAAGLLTLFLVDLVDMYWLSLLGEIELAAAIGYAGSILFFTLSLSIGLSIGCAALVSHSVGEENISATRQLVGNIFTLVAALTVVVAIVVEFFVPALLSALGAQGRAHELASSYLLIIIPSFPILAIAICTSGLLRALGHAKEAMYLTLIGGVVNALLDPILIFGLGWGIEGAAWASVAARVAMICYGGWRVTKVYALIAPPNLSTYVKDIRQFLGTAVPAVLTNLATPIGDSAVAGNAIIGKLQPLVFAGLFALSASIGPIAGQNLGAKNYDRVMATLFGSMKFIAIYSVVACLVLLALTDLVIWGFRVSGEAENLIRWFCYGLSTMFFFNGITFCTNALFNNLKLAHLATLFNFAKATVFTMPFVAFGAQWGGPVGILVGMYAGSVIVAILGLVVAYIKIQGLETTMTSKPLAETG